MSTCQSCHEREAVVHLTQVVGEQVTTVHLCGKCAAERGIATDSEAVATPLGSFLAALGPVGAAGAGAPAACPECGATLADIRASGRLGCATCWSTFTGPLHDLLRRLHGATRHTGEPYHDPADPDHGAERRLAHERIRLREALREAIEAEAFEQAAELRDRLRDLEDA